MTTIQPCKLHCQTIPVPLRYTRIYQLCLIFENRFPGWRLNIGISTKAGILLLSKDKTIMHINPNFVKKYFIYHYEEETRTTKRGRPKYLSHVTAERKHKAWNRHTIYKNITTGCYLNSKEDDAAVISETLVRAAGDPEFRNKLIRQPSNVLAQYNISIIENSINDLTQ